MNKKLMAVAVAGALAAPAVAFAQASTVQIYGLLNVEYGFYNGQPSANGVARKNVDALNSGASRIGFKGEEKLAGGTSAFWQCESDIRFLSGGGTQSGVLCDRNSALGLKGGFGSLFVGSWDSPLKRVAAITRITNETGWLGSQQMTLSAGGDWDGSFSLRNTNSINYDTPKFGGFSASAQITTNQAGRDANTTTTVSTPKGRLLSLSGQYVQGPMAIVTGYSKHDDNRSFSGTRNREDTAWLVGGTYGFGNFKMGLTYVVSEIEDATAGVSAERKSWNIAGDFKLSPAGTIRAGYSRAGDIKEKGPGAVTTNSGAALWQIGYLHSLSKRTTASLSYARIDNDGNSTNGGTYSFAGLTKGAGVQAGSNGSVIVLGLVHTF